MTQTLIDQLKIERTKKIREIDRLQQIVESLDRLIEEYDGQPVGPPEVDPLEQMEALPIEVTDLPLNDAILRVLWALPDYGWRGNEVTHALEKAGVELSHLPQRVSARLKQMAGQGKIERIEEPGERPRYRAKRD